ncbi:ERF family protein [Bradyrhizobium sp. MOS002]|uniref:DUF968 domain-containing protein n=1 Tax=Bradyrhizobium sp. MOS002 TaxID=2133947 RepID=UPI000D13B393|nr:ERF family protein [Bradyrhizobium sp. MOS002]PSO23668.1 single-stranded DNA-binding protein [Bradyrhizobium sp. MOS002]
MHQCSEHIGVLAAALARAQLELTNPEKSVRAVVRSPFPREDDRSFRYASLASGLDIVRKALGRHEIAILQTTRSDTTTQKIQLTTVLAHSSGEWVSSELPVCNVSDIEAPHRLGAALTYARRYALFAMVGMAGEDEPEAPEDEATGKPNRISLLPSRKARPSNGSSRNPLLEPAMSAQLRDQLLDEITTLGEGEDAIVAWAENALVRKSRLLEQDAERVEAAYSEKVSRTTADWVAAGTARALEPDQGGATLLQPEMQSAAGPLAIPKSSRVRSRVHLDFVRQQPCAVCQQAPCDPHHIKFAQRGLGRKVSDEFTVPLCRMHHIDLHRRGNERAWWANLQLSALELAGELWRTSPVHHIGAAETGASRTL